MHLLKKTQKVIRIVFMFFGIQLLISYQITLSVPVKRKAQYSPLEILAEVCARQSCLEPKYDFKIKRPCKKRVGQDMRWIQLTENRRIFEIYSVCREQYVRFNFIKKNFGYFLESNINV